jgi:hypothetical protein
MGESIKTVKIGKVKPNEENPRYIRDSKFKELVKSIKDFPEMLDIRPIIVDEDMIVLGGNMRLKACTEAGLKEVPTLMVKGWSDEKKKEFVVKDNLGFGQWDWDILANTYDADKLEEWGMQVFIPAEINVDDFFGEGSTEESEKMIKIVLEFPEDQHQIVMDKFADLEGSREEIVWNLLGLKNE